MQPFYNIALELFLNPVPLFLFINGYFLFSKREVNYKEHYIKTLKLFILTFIWAFLAALFCSLFNKDQISFKSIFDLTIQTKIGSTYTGYLWYMQGLIGLYLIYPLLHKLFNNSKKWYIFLLITSIVFSQLLNTISRFNYLATLYWENNFFNIIFDYLGRFNSYFIGDYPSYFMLGGFAYIIRNTIKKKRKLFILSGAFSYLVAALFGLWITFKTKTTYSDNFLYNSMTMIVLLLSYFAIFGFYSISSKTIKNIYRFFGNTFAPYMLHMICIYFVSIYIKWEWGNYLHNFTRCLLIFILTYFTSFIFENIKPLKALITT